MDTHARAQRFSPFPDNDTEITRLMMRHLLLQEEIASFCPDLRERNDVKTVLDVACGPGWWILAMAQRYRDVDFVGIATFLSRLYSDTYIRPDRFEMRVVMDKQTSIITFDDVSAANANRYAEELRQVLPEASPDVEVHRRPDDSHTQDFGATLVLLLGTPAAVALAKAIGLSVRFWQNRTDRPIPLGRYIGSTWGGVLSPDSLRFILYGQNNPLRAFGGTVDGRFEGGQTVTCHYYRHNACGTHSTQI